VEVIVQMGSGRSDEYLKLARAAGQALARRRLSLTPRDLLPGPFGKGAASGRQPESASMRVLMGQATREALGLAAIQQIGGSGLDALTKSEIVQTVLARMTKPLKKSGKPRRPPARFWTSRSMLLKMEKEEFQRLTSEVPNIQSVSANRRLMLPPTMESKPLSFEEAELLSASWGIAQANALAAWGAYGARGKGVLIGLLDTGVDATHPDLEGRAKKWAEFDSAGQKISGSAAHDSDQHGTHCAGTICGGNTSGRFIGMAPESRIAAGLVLNGEEGGTDAQILAGIDWAVNSGVDVLSMSLGGLVMDPETPPTYTEAILTCVEAGIPVVAAIGNEGHQTTGSPGNDLFALSVGAIDQRLRVAGFSGGRTQIIQENEFIDPKYLPLPYSKPDLVAPGVAVFSSVPGGKWKAFNGTSMAAPHVAGAIAMLLSATSIREKESGSRRALLVQDLITGSVDEMGEAGQDHRYGFGALNVLRAIDFARKRGY
ncbi:MAG: S8 family serine peptidase, partial [Bryobacteraceae bacterium]